MRIKSFIISGITGLLLVVALAGASCSKEVLNASSLVIDSIYRGAEDAKVTIIEFSDFSCPACKIAHANFKETIADYAPTEVRFVHKDLIIHGAELAIAARCVQMQNQELYWDYYDYLFDNQGTILATNILDKTKEFTRDTKDFNFTAFESCYTNRETEAVVMADHNQGLELGINSTPTFIINNQLIKGAPRSPGQIKQVIDDLLAQ